MTLQVVDDLGVNLTDQIPISKFELSWERDQISEFANIAPVRAIGHIYADFHDPDGEVSRQISAIADRHERITLNQDAGQPVRNSRVSIVANLDEGSWIQYKNVHLTSMNWSTYLESDSSQISTSWVFNNAETLSPNQTRKFAQRKIKTQKLDWLKLGF